MHVCAFEWCKAVDCYALLFSTISMHREGQTKISLYKIDIFDPKVQL